MSLRVVLWASLALAAIFAVQEWQTSEILYPDVWGFWTFGRYALTHAPATIYDDAALHAFQTGLGIPDENGFYPYPYPPWFLLAVTPLGWLPYPAAALLWRGVTFGGLVLAVGAWRWPRDGQWDRALLLAVAPACAVSFVVGQNGFLTAALMLGGVRLLPGRPVLGGALLGALAYKPQLAILVPFFLLFGGHWRALAGSSRRGAGRCGADGSDSTRVWGRDLARLVAFDAGTGAGADGRADPEAGPDADRDSRRAAPGWGCGAGARRAGYCGSGGAGGAVAGPAWAAPGGVAVGDIGRDALRVWI